MAGRYTNYSDELAEEAMAYINGGYEELGQAFPSIVGLCQAIGRAKTTIYRWAEDPDHPFKDIVANLLEIQELVVFNKSMKGEHNCTMAKLLLTKHGYSDKFDGTLGNTDGSNFSNTDEIDAKLARLLSASKP